MYGVVKALPVGATQKSTAVARFDTRLANRTSAPPASAASAEEESVAAESVASARVESAIEGESDPASVPVSGATSGVESAPLSAGRVRPPPKASPSPLSGNVVFPGGPPLLALKHAAADRHKPASKPART